MDTFNQFWKDLEGMLDNLSQPVAFATAPLMRFASPESVNGPDDRSYRTKRTFGNDNTAFTAGLKRPGQPGKHSPSVAVQKQSASPLRVSVDPTVVFKGKGHDDICDPEEVMADEGQHLCLRILFVSILIHKICRFAIRRIVLHDPISI